MFLFSKISLYYFPLQRSSDGMGLCEAQINAYFLISTRHRSVGCDGEMAEWFKAAVLKTVEGNSLPGFESLSLRQLFNLTWDNHGV